MNISLKTHECVRVCVRVVFFDCLQGLSTMAVAHGKLFTVSSLAQGGSVHVFSIDESGRLSEIPSLRRNPPPNADSLGLIGARALHVGQDFMYIASAVDQAVSLWTLNATTGESRYVDHIRNGERLVASFRTFVNDSVEAVNVGWDGQFPTRLGGNEKSFTFTARTVRPFKIDDRQMFAIAAGTDVVGAPGAFHVVEWVHANASMRPVQIMETEVRTSSGSAAHVICLCGYV